MQIAILGASGELGRKTVASILDSGFEAQHVSAVVRTPGKMSAWQDRGLQIRQGDYDEPASLRAAFDGVDRLLLIPTKAAPAQRVQQYENAISAAREAGVEHLLHFGIVGTSLALPSPLAPFLLYAESAVRTSGLAWTLLRNTIYADPIAEWIPDIINMGTIPYPTGNGRCAYVTRDDIARAAAAVLTTEGHAGETYNFTGPAALTTADLCDAIAHVTGKPVEHRLATDQDYLTVCRASGEPEFITTVLLSLYHSIRDGHFDLVSSDIERLTGRPPIGFEAFVRRHWSES